MQDHFKMAFGLGKAKTVDVVHIYNGMSLSHKKKTEQNNSVCSNMDGSRDCHTE